MTKKICLVRGEDVHKRIALSHYLIKAGFNITIPSSGFVPGKTRMRLKTDYSGYGYVQNDPCSNLTYGEIEDYTVNIIWVMPNYNEANHYISGINSSGKKTVYRMESIAHIDQRRMMRRNRTFIQASLRWILMMTPTSIWLHPKSVTSNS